MIARLTPRDGRSGRFGGRGRAGTWKGEAAMPFADQDLARRVEEAWAAWAWRTRSAGPAGPGIGGDGAAGGGRLRGVHGGGLAAVAGAGGGPVRAGGRRGARADGDLLPRAGCADPDGAGLAGGFVAAGALEPSGLPGGRADARPGAAARRAGARGRGALGSREAAEAGGGGGRGRADPAGRGGDLGRVGAPLLLRRARRSCPARSWKAPSRWPRSPW